MTASILLAFLPVFLVIAAGYVVRASGYLPCEFWRGVNALNHRLLLPAFLFVLLATADFSHALAPKLAALSAAGTLFILAVSLVAAGALRLKAGAAAATTGVAVQWNFVLTLALVSRLVGDGSEPLASAVVAPGILLGAAITVASYALASGSKIFGTIGRMVCDPLVVAGLAGLGANVLGISNYPPILTPIELIGAGALPVILLAMGAGLELSALKGRGAALLQGTVLRCLAGPVVFLGLAVAFGLSGPGAVVLALAGAAPAAAFVYAVAADFETETGLTAGMITLTVLVSAAVSPIAARIAFAL